MRPLDPRAQRELEEQIAANMWSRRSRWARLGLAVGLTTLMSAGLAAFFYLAEPRWWWVWSLGMFVGLLLLFLGFVFAPEAVIRHTYQAWYVSDDDARKRSTIP